MRRHLRLVVLGGGRQGCLLLSGLNQYVHLDIDTIYFYENRLPMSLATWRNYGRQQRQQRLAFGRVLVNRPRLVILDEATSALDSESEALVHEALERLMEGRTVFIIAHRLSTVRRCDRILVFEKGQIVESGTHEELLALERRYAKFYAQQFSS